MDDQVSEDVICFAFQKLFDFNWYSIALIHLRKYFHSIRSVKQREEFEEERVFTCLQFDQIF